MKRLGLAILALAATSSAAQTPLATSAAPPKQGDAGPYNGDQWLYGSAEGSVAAVEAYRALTSFALQAARRYPRSGVILAPGASPLARNPSFVPCGAKPVAVVFDADETLIWNIPPRRDNILHGGGRFDPETWAQWERTGAGHATAIPGVLDSFRALRTARITPIVITNRSSASADGAVATLKAAGLGDFVRGRTLFLAGDDKEGSSKDGRRSRVAQRYCVIAMVGDQLGDFSNAFNDPAISPAERRVAAASGPTAKLWGRGWFLISNPGYGPWQGKLRFDDVYGADPWTASKGAN